MFRFRGRLGRKRFAWGAAIRLLLMTVGVVGFPYFVWIVGQVTACGGVGGACGAVALMTSLFVKPVIAVVFVFSFLGIGVRRARDAGLPAWIGSVVTLLFLRDIGVLVFAGAHWSLAFATGFVGRGATIPVYGALSLACIFALCCLPSRAVDATPPGRWARLSRIAGTVAVAAASGLAAVQIALLTPLLGRFGGQALAAMAINPVRSFITLAVTIVFALLAWRSFTVPASAPLGPVPMVPAAHRGPVIAMAVLAIALTLTALLMGPAPALPTILLLPDTFLLTSVLYVALLGGVYLAVVSPRPRSFALLVLALLPFIQFSYARWATNHDRAAEAAELAAIPVVRMDQSPRTLLLESFGARGDDMLGIGGLERVILGGAPGRTVRWIQYERQDGQRSLRTDITSLPSSYLHLRTGASSSFRMRNRIDARTESGGPFELRRIENGRDDLVGIWYRTRRPMPTIPPLLSTAGWYRRQDGVPRSEPGASLRQFLANILPPTS